MPRDLLSSQLSSAEACLQSAAGESPMYGSLAVLYSRVIVWNSQWEEITWDIIALCHNIWPVVTCVVVSESPEGHLPSDHTRLSAANNTSTGTREILCTIISEVVVKDEDS